MFSCKDDSNSTTTNNTVASIQVAGDLISSDLIQTNEESTTGNNLSLTNQSDILWWRENLNLEKANLALVGFSKGCVVLNQVIIFQEC